MLLHGSFSKKMNALFPALVRVISEVPEGPGLSAFCLEAHSSKRYETVAARHHNACIPGKADLQSLQFSYSSWRNLQLDHWKAHLPGENSGIYAQSSSLQFHLTTQAAPNDLIYHGS